MAEKAETATELANLVSYIKEKDARIAKLEEDLKQATKRREQSQRVYDKLHPEPVNTTKVEDKPPEPAEKPHFVGWWQKTCPECGEDNPEFKDETVCEGCGAHLGEATKVEKMKACPSCGGKKAKMIQELKKDIGAIGEPIKA